MKDYNLETAKFLNQLSHVVIAVVDEDYKPWAVPVRIKKLDGLQIEWDSHTKARHSLAIAHEPHIALTAFVSKGDEWDETGVYIEAEVVEIEPIHDEFARYKAHIRAVWYNDAEHVKRSVDLDELSPLLT